MTLCHTVFFSYDKHDIISVLKRRQKVLEIIVRRRGLKDDLSCKKWLFKNR